MLMYYGCDRAGQFGKRGSHEREGRRECCDNFEVSRLYPLPVSVKDHAVLAPMTIFELCTDRMSCFMGSGKSSSFCNYYVEPHLPTSCGTFTFRGRMRPRAKTSSQEQGGQF
jgi:hypothetical protein